MTKNNKNCLARVKIVVLAFLLCHVSVIKSIMRDSTFVTHADVYDEKTSSSPESVELPGPSECVMVSGDSPPPMQASLPLVDYDATDEATVEKGNSTLQPLTALTTKLLTSDADAETIETIAQVTENVLPVPEPKPVMEKNGIDAKKPATYVDDNSCVIDCIYYTQQCCECIIL